MIHRAKREPWKALWVDITLFKILVRKRQLLREVLAEIH